MSMSPHLRRLRERVGHELLEVPSATVALRDAEGRVLLARHAAGDVWVLPGGAIEPEESPADAAVREAYEETGILVELERIVGVYGGPGFTVRYPNGDACAYITTVFEARSAQTSGTPDGVEVVEIRFFSEAEIASVRTARWVSEVLADVFGRRATAGFRPATWRPSSPA